MNATGECCSLRRRVACGSEGLFIGIAGDAVAAVRNGVKQREAAGCARCTRLSRASRGRCRSGERCDQLGLRLGTNWRGGTSRPALWSPLDRSWNRRDVSRLAGRRSPRRSPRRWPRGPLSQGGRSSRRNPKKPGRLPRTGSRCERFVSERVVRGCGCTSAEAAGMRSALRDY
jgi:hypothetical protein